MAKASPTLEYFRLPLTGHFDSLSTTSPSANSFLPQPRHRRFREYWRRTTRVDDPLSREAEYDPQSAAISSAYVSAFNDYVRKDLKYGEGKEYKPEIEVWRWWNFIHQAPGAPFALPQAPNVMTDLAGAMKYNPDLKVLVNAGYFDLATPFCEGIYEMQHLPISPALQKNIEFQFYESGHMVYAREASLKALHDNVAAFIAKTENSKTGR